MGLIFIVWWERGRRERERRRREGGGKGEKGERGSFSLGSFDETVSKRNSVIALTFQGMQEIINGVLIQL